MFTKKSLITKEIEVSIGGRDRGDIIEFSGEILRGQSTVVKVKITGIDGHYFLFPDDERPEDLFEVSIGQFAHFGDMNIDKIKLHAVLKKR